MRLLKAILALGLFASPLVVQAAEAGLGIGNASFYGAEFVGRRTASGEAFDPQAMTAAHRTVPFGSLIRVTNLSDGRTVVVRVNDRGPWSRDRIIDLSYAAAKQIGLHRSGMARVELTLLAR
jgi:rare lipoprotein A